MTSTLKIFKYRKSKRNVFACVYMSSRIKHCYYVAWSVIPFIHHFFSGPFESMLQVCTRPRFGTFQNFSSPLSQASPLAVFPDQNSLGQGSCRFSHCRVVDTDATTDLRAPCLSACAERPLCRLPGWTGLQRVWLYRILPGGQVVQPGNEAELFHGIDFVMRHRSKEEEATEEFIFFSPISPHRLFQDAVDLHSLSGGGLCSQTTKLWICGQIKNAGPHNRCPSFLASLLHCSRVCFSEVAPPPPQFSVST